MKTGPVLLSRVHRVSSWEEKQEWKSAAFRSQTRSPSNRCCSSSTKPFSHVSWEFALVQRTQLAVLRSCLKHGHLNTQRWLLCSAALVQSQPHRLLTNWPEPLLRASGSGSTGQKGSLSLGPLLLYTDWSQLSAPTRTIAFSEVGERLLPRIVVSNLFIHLSLPIATHKINKSSELLCWLRVCYTMVGISTFGKEKKKTPRQIMHVSSAFAADSKHSSPESSGGCCQSAAPFLQEFANCCSRRLNSAELLLGSFPLILLCSTVKRSWSAFSYRPSAAGYRHSQQCRSETSSISWL